MKKQISLLSLIMMLFIIPCSSVFASEIHDTSFEYDGVREELIGEYTEYIKPDNPNKRDNYREYYRYKIYDQGITKEWSYTSNPYFIISIAKGMTYEKEKIISGTISATISGNLPQEGKKKVFSSFGASSSGSKTLKTKVTFSGPSNNAISRDFYYQLGRNTHSVRVVEEFCTNWDGVIRTKTYYVSVGVPAIKTYSKERYKWKV